MIAHHRKISAAPMTQQLMVAIIHFTPLRLIRVRDERPLQWSILSDISRPPPPPTPPPACLRRLAGLTSPLALAGSTRGHII